MPLSNDSPISKPDEDLYGLDPFAKAIARAIEKMPAPEGVVLAINGPWGSGKSSAINLIRHHLAPAIDNEELVEVVFNPWWFNGTEALTFAFFRELAAAVGTNLSTKVSESLSVIGAHVSAAGPLLGTAANLKLPGSGKWVEKGAALFGRLTKHTKTLDQEHKSVSKALKDQNKRFIVIIDDIDRLSPDDALTVFRLVKSVGRLPNVIYLLSFDRALAEAAAANRFPSEGPAYLEKILQGAFDIPPPSADVLRKEIVEAAVAIMGEPAETTHTRFWNVFMDVVAPLLRTPRDVARIANDLAVTWPAVVNEVDRADFLALSALKLLRPKIYAGIRAHPDELCGSQSSGGRDRNQLPARYDEDLSINELPERERDGMRMGLRRLFPRLSAIYANTFHGSDDESRRSRHVASRDHFGTYFAFSLVGEVLPASDMARILDRAGDEAFIQAELAASLDVRRANGATRASLILEELTISAPLVAEEKVQPLLSAVFAMADKLDVEADEQRGFGAIGDNSLRIHWLCNRLVTDRFDLERRDAIYLTAAQSAPFGWLTDFSDRCLRFYLPRENGDAPSPGSQLTTEKTARRLVALARKRVRAAAADGSLLGNRRLPRLLFDWARQTKKGTSEVRRWTDDQLSWDEAVVAFADMTISTATVASMGWDGDGDRVARKQDRVDLKTFEHVLDGPRLEARVDEVLKRADLDEESRRTLERFKAAPRKSAREF